MIFYWRPTFRSGLNAEKMNRLHAGNPCFGGQHPIEGDIAKRLGRGLQNLSDRFDSDCRLQSHVLIDLQLISSVETPFCYDSCYEYRYDPTYLERKSMNLTRRNGKYHFRFYIPIYLQERLGNELHISLKTYDKTIALRLSSGLKLHLRRRLRMEENPQEDRKELDRASLKAFINDVLESEAEQFKEHLDHDVNYTLERLDAEREELAAFDQQEKNGDYCDAFDIVNEYETVANRKLSRIDHHEASQLIFKQIRSNKKRTVKFLEKGLEKELAEREPETDLHQSQMIFPEKPKDSSPLLSVAAGEFIEDTKAKARQKSKDEYLGIYRVLIEAVGDIQVGQFTATDMQNFRKMLKKYPIHRHKKPIFKGKTIHEIVKMDHDVPLLSDASQKKFMNRIGEFFKWGKAHTYCTTNWTEGIVVKVETKPNQEPMPFEDDDILKMFSPGYYLKASQNRSSRYWVPLIGLMTGMRQNEICQLYLQDIKQDDESDVWYIEICETAGTRKIVKNNSSWRKVPIHPKLIELGFLNYVEKIRKQGSDRLFPELKLYKAQYGREISRWFNGPFKRSIIREDTWSRKDFHSLRRYFIDYLYQKSVSDNVGDDIVGHSSGKMRKRYANKFEVKTMMEEGIMKFDLELDWEGLRKDWKEA